MGKCSPRKAARGTHVETRCVCTAGIKWPALSTTAGSDQGGRLQQRPFSLFLGHPSAEINQLILVWMTHMLNNWLNGAQTSGSPLPS